MYLSSYSGEGLLLSKLLLLCLSLGAGLILPRGGGLESNMLGAMPPMPPMLVMPLMPPMPGNMEGGLVGCWTIMPARGLDSRGFIKPGRERGPMLGRGWPVTDEEERPGSSGRPGRRGRDSGPEPEAGEIGLKAEPFSTLLFSCVSSPSRLLGGLPLD